MERGDFWRLRAAIEIGYPAAMFARRISLWTLCLLLSAAQAHAADETKQEPTEAPEPNPCLQELVDYTALPYGVSFGGDVPEEEHEAWMSAADSALGWVKNLAPEGDHLFHWKGPRAPLQHKRDATFHFTALKEAQKIPGLGSHILDGSDAGTFTHEDGTEVGIYTFLFTDTLLTDPASGERRPDTFVRLVAALGHEIFGNVQRELETDVTRAIRITPLLRAQQEVRAFTAGVAFLERCLAFADAQSLDATLRRQFAEAIAREKRARDGWQAEVDRLLAAAP